MSRILPLLALALFLGGCSNYWSARRQDTADLLTLSATTGAGVSFQAGPVQISPVAQIVDVAGLRGGEWFGPQLDEYQTAFPMDMGMFWWTSSALILPGNPRLEERGKAYVAFPSGADNEEMFARHTDTFPFLTIPRTTWAEEEVSLARVSTAYWGQVEIALALGGGIRLGTNLLEWADFAAGWFGLDLLDDDRP
jgi:hypothetical protein